MTLPAALLLDLDGTTVDTEPLHQQAHRTLWRRRGHELDEALLVESAGIGDLPFYRKAFAARGWNDSDIEAWVSGKNRILHELYQSGVAPTPGVECLLDHCNTSQIPVHVVTSCDRAGALAVLRAAGLLHRLPALICWDDVERPKPDGQPYALAARRLGVEPASCLAIEDSPTGCCSAINAGCRVLGFADTAGADALIAAGAERVIQRMDESIPIMMDATRA